VLRLCVCVTHPGIQLTYPFASSISGASPWSSFVAGEALVAISFSTKSLDLLSSAIRVISHASRHHSSVRLGSVYFCQPSTPRASSLVERFTWATW
ncbi:Hypothetical protein DHA2_154491, partial [Giardia duodenalis]